MLAEIVEPIHTKQGTLMPGQLVKLPDNVAVQLGGKLRPAVLPGGLTLADMEAELGSDPDWPTLTAGPELLRGHAESIAGTRQVRAGMIPDGWTGVFCCVQCGSVYLSPGGPEDLLACPWCFNQEHGLPIPRPASDRGAEDTRTADQLTPAERSRWCLEHELTCPGARCKNKENLYRCVLWNAIRKRQPLPKLHPRIADTADHAGYGAGLKGEGGHEKHHPGPKSGGQ